MIRYYKLFDILNRKGMNKSSLLAILSSKTIAKLSKGENVNVDVINKICEFLECQPGDIMEYVYEATNNITGDKVELADHTSTWEDNAIRPKPDSINIYPIN